MDVSRVLSDNVNRLVASIPVDTLLESLYPFVTENIALNFDSQNIYLTKSHLFGVPIDESSPLELIQMIKNLIEMRLMGENIRNSSNRIHFRCYADNVSLDTKDNFLRSRLFICACDALSSLSVSIFLFTKLLGVRNLLSKLDTNGEEFHAALIELFRVRTIIRAIEEHNVATEQHSTRCVQ
jgi:hypothetical protein